MPTGCVQSVIPAPSAEVFRLLHDYDRRLEWDTLLQDARLCDGHEQAGLHATSICTGHWYLGSIPMKTEYVSYEPGEVAAVRMVNYPPFFETFAASIRHENLGEGTSRITYRYNFRARPKWLRWLLHPVMSAMFRLETTKRLNALSRAFA